MEQLATSQLPAPELITNLKRPILRKPAWFRSLIPGGSGYVDVGKKIHGNGLHTVCESASCPNLGECWQRGTATFMILGNTCTRGCRFCDVPKGKPGIYDRDEPRRVAEAASTMNLKHIVLTSVNRDELSDQGAYVWAETIRAVRSACAGASIETLIPDMQGNMELLDIILEAKPDILNHNFETVERLQQPIRGRGNIQDSSAVLIHAKEKGFITKTSLMLGMGEEEHEVHAMIDLAVSIKVDIVTLGQYLQPSLKHWPVHEYIHPDRFAAYREYALTHGIRISEASPLQRSSFKAEDALSALRQS